MIDLRLFRSVVVAMASFVSIPGELNGTAGRFEWIVDEHVEPYASEVRGGRVDQWCCESEMIMYGLSPLPPSLILDPLLPTGAELAWGHRHGWVSADGVVGVALAKMMSWIYRQ